jgi:hypothetical protein
MRCGTKSDRRQHRNRHVALAAGTSLKRRRHTTHTHHMSNPARSGQCAAKQHQHACCGVLLCLSEKRDTLIPLPHIYTYSYTQHPRATAHSRHPTPHKHIAHTYRYTRFSDESITESHANCSICIMLLAACLTILHAQQPRVVVWTREVHGHNLQ